MQLRDYQMDALGVMISDLDKYQRISAVMPTGSGKSIIEVGLIDSMVKQLKFNECILVLCHIKDVTVQLYENYKIHSEFRDESFLWSGARKPFFSSKILFSTMQSASADKRRMQGPMSKTVVGILIDEAHLFGCKSYMKICETFYPTAKVIGFSATPFRENQYSFSLFDHVSYAIDIQTLIDQGYLCPPKLMQMAFPDKDFGTRLATMVKIWRERERQRKLVSIVYLPTIDMAMEARNVFGEAGARTGFVEAKTNERETASTYRKARQGQLDVICNVNKISVGIDIPSIGAVFMPYPTGSVAQYLQRIGRALRMFEGKKEAHIYVMSDAPSIKRGDWQKIHDFALGVKKDPTTPGEKLMDEYDFLMLDELGNKDRIAWTMEAMKAVEILESNGLPEISQIIASKQFPNKYAKVIKDIIKNIEKPKPSNAGAISPLQKKLLIERFKFKENHVKKLGKGEATELIAGMLKFHSRSPYVIPTGPMAGKHCADVPGLYKKNVKDPAVKQILYKWYRAGRPKSDV